MLRAAEEAQVESVNVIHHDGIAAGYVFKLACSTEDEAAEASSFRAVKRERSTSARFSREAECFCCSFQILYSPLQFTLWMMLLLRCWAVFFD